MKLIKTEKCVRSRPAHVSSKDTLVLGLSASFIGRYTYDIWFNRFWIEFRYETN